MDESPTNPHYHTLDGCTFIYTYIQNTQIIVAQFLHMGELTPQQLTKSQNNIAQFQHMGESKPQQLTKSQTYKFILYIPCKDLPRE